MVFIQKAGKSSHSTAKDYRPISLSSFLLKTMERLIDHFIRNGLEESLLSKSQHAYWKGRSTETTLHTIVRCLEDDINRKEYTLVAFLDIEGAFNNVKADAIISSLRRHDIDPGISTWIENMLLGRVVSSELVGSSITRQVKRGTPPFSS